LANHYVTQNNNECWKKWSDKDFLDRTHVAAKLVNKLPIQYVYDFGCGEALLRPLLREGLTYHGYDTRHQLEGVECVDLNEAFPSPELGTKGVRCAACLGFLEYVDDHPRFIHNLSRYYRFVVFSYMSYKANQFHHLGRRIHSYESIVSWFKRDYAAVRLYSVIDHLTARMYLAHR
jgi:hypothetical protein